MDESSTAVPTADDQSSHQRAAMAARLVELEADGTCAELRQARDQAEQAEQVYREAQGQARAAGQRFAEASQVATAIEQSLEREANALRWELSRTAPPLLQDFLDQLEDLSAGLMDRCPRLRGHVPPIDRIRGGGDTIEAKLATLRRIRATAQGLLYQVLDDNQVREALERTLEAEGVAAPMLFEPYPRGQVLAVRQAPDRIWY